MSQKAFGAENINDVMKVRMRAVMGAGGGGESGGVAVTEHLLKLLLNFVMCLRVGAQQM